MTKAKTDSLYVNLSASQTRKRLKGHGCGVRRVEAVGRNQAAISHTATGGHLRKLEALFADVRSSASREELGTSVENLKNLGPASAGWLRDAGVRSVAELERLGPVLAYRLVKQQQPGASLNLLWAMAAGLSDRDWRELSPEEKERLRKEAEEE